MQHPFYEQLGAPVLLYRNRETYTALDEDATLCNTAIDSSEKAATLFVQQQLQLYRTQTRWYYPTDAHVLSTVLPPADPRVKTLYKEWLQEDKEQQEQKQHEGRQQCEQKQSETETLMDLDMENDEKTGEPSSSPAPSELDEEPGKDSGIAEENGPNDDADNSEAQSGAESRNDSGDEIENLDDLIVDLEKLVHQYDDDGKTMQDDELETRATDAVIPIAERNAALKSAFRNRKEQQKRIFRLQLETRARMLLARNHNPSEMDCAKARQTLRSYTQLDASYIPSKVQHVAKEETRYIHDTLRLQTELYDRERLNRAIPAYVAPFHLPSLKNSTEGDIISRGIPSLKKFHRREIPAIPRDDPNAPSLFGNCLLSFPCKCGACSTASTNDKTQPTACLLHPVGPLQDRVRLSFLSLPRGRRMTIQKEPRANVPEELEVGDRVRQLEQCGLDPYVAVVRTSECVIVFSVTFVKPRQSGPLVEGECWGNADLQLLHRIDHRTLWRNRPSYRPVDVACHPRYGVGGFTPSKIAVLYESDIGDRNIIHHLQLTGESLTFQEQTITNLQDISEIDFASHNPMMLWVVARSYVRPALTSSHLYHKLKRPRIGHGSSLYSIDLCVRGNSEATFHWSPSAADFLPEGVNSISSIRTDWNKPHRLWIASTSAVKTWEIDTRMPCRAVNSWSLPHMCDQTGALLPVAGLYGSGILFAHPHIVGEKNDVCKTGQPMLSVGKSPGTFGIHLYQRPLVEPRFQTQSIECSSSPAISSFGKMSAATSSTFALPDVSDRIYTCGLTVFRRPWKNYLETTHRQEKQVLGLPEKDLTGVLCAVSLTSKGDVYVHNLLESLARSKRSKNFDGLPVGCSMISVPESTETGKSPGSWNKLRVSLRNEFPVPSHAILPLLNTPQMGDETIIDLIPILEKEETTLKKRIREDNKRKRHNLELSRSEAIPDNLRSDGGSNETNKNDEDVHDKDLASKSSPPTFAQISRKTQGAVVISSVPNTETASLRLPSHLLPNSDHEELEHCQLDKKSTVEDIAEEGRSDLTREVLSADWRHFADDTEGD